MQAGIMKTVIMPRQVFLFSGHMADAPNRPSPRLPMASMPAAAACISAIMDTLNAGAQDLALTQGSSGGDVLFAEACLARGMSLQLLLPRPEPAFVKGSLLVSAFGEHWRERFLALKANPATCIKVMPDGLSAATAGGNVKGNAGANPGANVPSGNVYTRCNHWLLNTACEFGLEKLHVICLWDGAPGFAGGTAHLHELAVTQNARIHWIDSRTL